MGPRDTILTATLLDELTTLVSRAAAAVLAARAGALATRAKADLSPVTAADEASEAVIVEGLRLLLPGVPIVSEEAYGEAPPNALPDTFFLVDPVDGTYELVAGRDEFSINLALVRGGKPVLGIVAAPTAATLWRAIDRQGAERLRLTPGAESGSARERVAIRPRRTPAEGVVAAISRSHFDEKTQAFLARFPKVTQLRSGSAIKFCQVAEGGADVYPRLAPVREWDVAAGHAILAIAGGRVMDPNGAELSYGQVAGGFLVPGFIAWGDPATALAQGVSVC